MMHDMRAFSLGCFLASSSLSVHAAPVSVDTSAFGSDGDSELGVGFTLSGTTRPYTDADPLFAALPYLTANKNGFYINGVTAGYELTVDPDPFVAPKRSLRIDILASPRFLDYKAEESPVLEGLEDIGYTIHGGASFSLVNAPVSLNLQILTDLLNVSGGSEVNGTISKMFTMKKLSLTPAFSLNWQDEALVDHYYGVEVADATVTRSQYSVGSTLNAAVS